MKMALFLQTDNITLLAPILILFIFASYAHGAPHVQRFSSHVSFNSPARSFYHGVGDLHPIQPLRSHSLHGNLRQKLPKVRSNSFRSLHGFPDNTIYLNTNRFEGYPRQRPLTPFTSGYSHSNIQQTHVSFGDNSIGYVEPYTIPVLPPSPYKVDSPDPESLWPEGLFIPPSIPAKYKPYDNRLNHNFFSGINDISSNHIVDPFFLDGDDALRAISHANVRGELFHGDIPHVRALLANQELRISNGLRPNRLGSIRDSSPWFRD